MAIKWASAGVKSVGEYQCSGVPWVSSSFVSDEETLKVEFPYVTRTIVVRNSNTGSANTSRMAVGFTEHGIKADVQNFQQPTGSIRGGAYSGNNYITLLAGESLSMELRIKDLFLSASKTDVGGLGIKQVQYEIIAGLTDILREAQPAITGSNGYDGVG